MGIFLRAVECWYEGYNTQAYYDIQTHTDTHEHSHQVPEYFEHA